MSGILGATIISPRGYSAEAGQFIGRVVDPGVKRCNLYAAMIDGFVNDGTWSLFYGLSTHAADVVATAKINLKSSSYNCTQSGTLTFSADHGFTGDGSTGYLDTGFPNKTGFSQNSKSFGYYCLTARTANQSYMAMGADDGAAPNDLGSRWTGGPSPLWCESSGLGFPTADATSNASGMFIASVTNSTTGNLYRNGSTTPSDTATGTTVAVTTAHNMYLFARAADPGPGADNFTGDQQAAAFVAQGLTATQTSQIASRINTYLAGLPTPVNKW